MKIGFIKLKAYPGKKQLALIAILTICFAIVASGTMAYFTAEETAYNVITMGRLGMELVEEPSDGKPWPAEGISGIVPGIIIDKKPYIVNKGSVDFYTRASVSIKVTASNGNSLSAEYIQLDINTTDWTEKDGYYYYNRILAPGEKTEPLFTKVSFAKEMHNAYQGARTEIDINAQAVQSGNNGSDPLSALGWE